MAGLILVSSEPLSGKTAIAAGLAGKLRTSRVTFALTRTGDDGNAAADGAFFSRFPGAQAAAPEVLLTEAPAGDIGSALGDNPGVRAILIATPAMSPEEIAGHVRAAGPVSGVIVNRVPAKRVEALRSAYRALGVQPLAVVPEDRVLAAPTLGQLAEALKGEGRYIEENRDRVLDRPIINSIAADPGQTYFARTDAEAVIVRSDKPDLQLAALNAGAACLIVTGGLPVLSYVLERVEADEIPLVRTSLDTKETVEVLEGLFGATPFSGEDKVKRIESLLGDLDIDALLERSAGRI